MLNIRRPIYLRVALLAAMLAAAGCQSAPVQEMSDARQAIAVAREAGAAEFAADDLRAAIDYLQSAERYLSEHAYAFARRDAVSAKSKALEALQRSAPDQESEP